jgi:hypothetical protein
MIKEGRENAMNFASGQRTRLTTHDSKLSAPLNVTLASIPRPSTGFGSAAPPPTMDTEST